MPLPLPHPRRRVASAPDTYLDRLRRENEKRLEYAKQKQQDQDQRLLEDVTFEPRTTRCPTYIKRIARGMALVKQAQLSASVDDAPQRPGWR